MAAKYQNKTYKKSSNHRLATKMGHRNVEIRPVGAWVQPGPIDNFGFPEACVQAQFEEERLHRARIEKEEKLMKFQQEVKERVKVMARLKSKQQLEKSYRAVEMAGKVVGQSAFAAEIATPRKNRCLLRDETQLTIQTSPVSSDRDGATSDSDLDKVQAFEEHRHQVRKFTHQARRNLLSRKVISDEFVSDDLPGGVWKTSATLDHPVSRSTLVPDVVELGNGESTAAQEEDEDFSAPAEVTQSGPKVVQFKLDTYQESRQDRIARRSTHELLGSQVERNLPVPNIKPGLQNEEEKQRAVSQRAMYRRLFMDIEREQVKENIRRKEHRKNISRLKKEKEEERERAERQARLMVATTDPVTGETSEEALRRRLHEEREFRQQEIEQKRKVQKSKELERYVDALRANLKEKIYRQNIHLPALCSCGDSIWDTSPETCANNCVFYRNPTAYVKALQMVLGSCDVL